MSEQRSDSLARLHLINSHGLPNKFKLKNHYQKLGHRTQNRKENIFKINRLRIKILYEEKKSTE